MQAQPKDRPFHGYDLNLNREENKLDKVISDTKGQRKLKILGKEQLETMTNVMRAQERTT